MLLHLKTHNYEIFQSGWWKTELFPVLLSFGHCSFQSFLGGSFPSLRCFFACLSCSVSSWILKRNPGRSVEFSFCAALQYSVLWTPATLFSPDLWLCCFYSECLSNYLGSSSLHHILEILKSVSWTNFSLHLFPIYQWSLFSIVCCVVVWKLLLRFSVCFVFFVFVFFSGKMVKSNHCCFFLVGSRSPDIIILIKEKNGLY